MFVLNHLMSFLTDPLVLLGLFLTAVLLLIRFLMAKDVLGPWPEAISSKVPARVLAHLYVLGLLLVVLGLVLKHMEMRHADQENALQLLLVDFNQNLENTESIANNALEMRASFSAVSEALRGTDAELMVLMFPKDMIPPKDGLDIGKKVEAAFATIKDRQLFDNKAAMNAFKAGKAEIKPLVKQRLQFLESIEDKDGRYLVRDDNLLVYVDILREISGLDLPAYDVALKNMKALRSQYSKVHGKTQNYFSQTDNFLARNTFISNGDVYEILAQEQQAFSALHAFNQQLKQELPAIQQTHQQMQQLLRELASD